MGKSVFGVIVWGTMTRKTVKIAKGCTHELHYFSTEEINIFQTCLLAWYSKNKRRLPWREIAEVEEDENKRGYCVWVSEIMLQQTQVATVISYYNRWMEKFPTVKTLSQGTLEDVHKLWAGLGYYSRGTRLLEGAKKIEDQMNGQVPQSSSELIKIPGIGRYTACAVASIAYGERKGVVDGNVLRVMTRLRLIGSDVTNQETVEHIWSLADQVVDQDRPGDFNQAVMELGAAVCLPRNPLCAACPISSICKAFERTRIPKPKNKNRKEKASSLYDIEDCHLCLPKENPFVTADGVQNYPRKKKKTAAREQKYFVYIVHKKEKEFLVFQRPSEGLFANLWEFPCIEADEEMKDSIFLETIGIKTSAAIKCGETFHKLSHINQYYIVNELKVDGDSQILLPSTHQKMEWLTEEKIKSSVASTAMKKIFQEWKNKLEKTVKPEIRRKRKADSKISGGDMKRQPSINSFFKAE
ncbi:adenine DNA glycosylase-like isoform X2 [Artemia franciscana]|uniref:adenine DNA glycosylase-like isoform X2 n=1 Tax=Artemia franciscana TaxID=6661 RepID=UPI0032DA27EF